MQLSTEAKIAYLKMATGNAYELTSELNEKFNNEERVDKPYSYGCNDDQIVLGSIETTGAGGTNSTGIHIGFHSTEGNDGFFIDDNAVELANQVIFSGLFQKVEGNTLNGTVIISGDLFTRV